MMAQRLAMTVVARARESLANVARVELVLVLVLVWQWQLLGRLAWCRWWERSEPRTMRRRYTRASRRSTGANPFACACGLCRCSTTMTMKMTTQAQRRRLAMRPASYQLLLKRSRVSRQRWC